MDEGLGSRRGRRGRNVRIVILLAVIWFVITLPLPFLVNNPDVPEGQFNTILAIVAVMSIPFVMLGIAWTLRPELTRAGE